MKNKLERVKNKIIKIYKRFITFTKTYLKTNIIFISYILVSLINSTILRFFTTEAFWNIKPFLADLAVILLIGSIGYFIKPNKRFIYYFSWTIIFTLICLINSVYYNNYVSFVSFY